MQQMDDLTHDSEENDAGVLRAEIVDEMQPGAPWQWREVRPVRPRRRVRLPVLLFIATCLSTLMAGMSDEAADDLGYLDTFIYGLWYAVPVMTILVCHEMGHFIQAHRYGVYASWPYFIPMPFSPLGTLGAVIAMEPRMGHRKALFDIGISGPLAGLVPTFIFLLVGLHYSTIRPWPEHGIVYGDPLLFKFLATKILHPIPEGYYVAKDPMAFAGWVGLLITSLNLIPIGQLDGGHVLYAMLRERANRVAALLLLFAVVIVVLHFRQYGNWLPMLVLIYFVVGTVHPPTADDNEPLGIGRIVLGWLTLAFIVIGFTPTPLRFLP
jgi:membrane-associated protease RseP (regulator of RpoE activity)